MSPIRRPLEVWILFFGFYCFILELQIQQRRTKYVNAINDMDKETFKKKKGEKNNESPSMFQNSSIFANNILVVNKNIAYSLQWVPHNLNLYSPL